MGDRVPGGGLAGSCGVVDADRRQVAAETGLDFAYPFSSFHDRRARIAYRYEGRFAPRDQSLVREDAAVDPTRSGKWAAPEHRERLIDQFERFPALFDILQHYGYSSDRSWFERLMAPDAGPSADGEE